MEYRKDVWVPLERYKVEEWLKWIYPNRNWKKVPRAQLYAIYFSVRDQIEKQFKKRGK